MLYGASGRTLDCGFSERSILEKKKEGIMSILRAGMNNEILFY